MDQIRVSVFVVITVLCFTMISHLITNKSTLTNLKFKLWQRRHLLFKVEIRKLSLAPQQDLGVKKSSNPTIKEIKVFFSRCSLPTYLIITQISWT